MLALVFLGSPGCGCSDDLPDTPGEEERECCCEFEWIPLGNQFGATVDIVLLNAHASLQAEARPAQLTGVNSGEPQLFDLCVQEDHAIGATVTVEFHQGALLLGSAILVYDQRCEPSITQPSDRLVLTSTDCADECCCDIIWEVTDDNLDADTVTLDVIAQAPGVRARVNPAVLTDVTFGGFETFQICLNDDHPVPTQGITIQATLNGGGVLWTVDFRYDVQCNVIPQLDDGDPLMYSPDCGGAVPLNCCCDFTWTATDPDWGSNRTVEVVIESQSAGMGATVNCTQCDNVGYVAGAPDIPAEFTVCVSPTHPTDGTVTIVVREQGGGAMNDRTVLVYGRNCTPGFDDNANPPPVKRGVFALVSCGNGLVDVMQK